MKSIISSCRKWSLAILLLHSIPILAGDVLEEALKAVEDALESDLTQDFDEVKTWFEGEVSKDIAKGLQASHGILGQISMGHSTVPPISTSLKTSKLDSLIEIGLYDAEGGYTQPASFAFAEQEYNGWDNSWFGIALESFDAEFEVDIDLSGSASGDLSLSLLTLPLTYDGVGVEVEFELHLTADASASMSFTLGLELALNKPAAIMMPALDPLVNVSQSQRIGFHADDFTLTPIFNASMPHLDFNMRFSLRSIFSVTVEDIDVGSIFLDLPAFDLNVDTLSDKTSKCETPPPGTPADQIYAELIHLDGKLEAVLSYEFFGGEVSGTIDRWVWLGMDKCYAFLPGFGAIGDVPPSSTASVLTAAPVTTCTTGGNSTTVTSLGSLKLLSGRDVAAIAFGTSVGILLVAVLAWYGGRASQRRSSRESRIDKTQAIQRSWFGNLFSRNDYDEKFISSNVDYFTPSPPVQQFSDHILPNSAHEPQMQYRSFMKRKPVPVASTSQVTSPYSLSETWKSPEMSAMEYGGLGAGEGEGLGLLQGERRFSGR